MARRITLALALLLAVCEPSVAQEPIANPHATSQTQPEIEAGEDYRVYDRQGQESSVLAIVGSAIGDDVLLVGEEHDDMIGHAFETLLYEAALEEIGGRSASGRTVILSLEMFERDVQYVLDEYLKGLISEDHFLKSSRPWDDYDVRYRDLVEAAKEHGTPVVAANAPRRYVSRVTGEGPESLSDLSEQARGFLPPLPYPGPSNLYREQWETIMAEAMESMIAAATEASSEASEVADDGESSSDGEEVEDSEEVAGPEEDEEERGYTINPNAIYSQALWDASMGHAISEALVRHLGGFVVHFAGSFHVEKGTGILERIEDYRPGTRVTTVVMTKVDDINAWSVEDHAELADFVILTKKPEPVEHPPVGHEPVERAPGG
jgi:uncharacterized iron-regulated protein